jgi:hypothetical protein
MELVTDEGVLTVGPGQAGFLQILNPRQPPERLQGKTGFELPDCGIGLLDAIPPVGSKFKAAATTGPQGQPIAARGESVGSVAFLFRQAP